jgi:preprotein translocase subunit SecA
LATERLSDVIFRTEETKFRAITLEILRNHIQGRPLLVGTTSVELSERLSNRLRADPLRRLAQVQLIRHAWLEQNQRTEDGRLIAELQHLNVSLDQIQLADLRKMARDLGIPFNPEELANLARLQSILSLADKDQKRLVGSLEGGVPHQVLNARKHTEESQIIAGAGSFGAVMIATNMAGRGVDIKLGGDLPEDVVDTVNRVLRRAGQQDPYDLSMEERYQALTSLNQDLYGIYGTQINHYIQYVQDMAQVKSLGGLHVIGSERHEARRIDNQLRGRSARQGDPGSSRFYLSLEDELMRRFGGDQADNLMKRMKIDDAVPMEVGLVSRLVEQSQSRVEGANFDIRKHLLEYDDVLNSQRSKIYSQRDRIFTKEDLHDDVVEMLRSEVQGRVPEALDDPDGPWKLLAWLDQIQPSLTFSNTIYPSYTLRLLLQHLADKYPQFKDMDEIRQALLELAGEALKAEEEHLHRNIMVLLDSTRTRMENQLKERLEVLDTFFEGLELEDKEDSPPKGPRELLEELSSLVHVPIRLSADEQRLLRSDPQQAMSAVRTQVEVALANQTSVRLLGAIERRTNEELDINATQLSSLTWDANGGFDYQDTEIALNKRRERLLGENGQIDKDLRSLEKISPPHD